MSRKDDKKPDLELNLIAEGLAAIADGDVKGGTDALRYAQDIQEENARRDSRDNPKR